MSSDESPKQTRFASQVKLWNACNSGTVAQYFIGPPIQYPATGIPAAPSQAWQLGLESAGSFRDSLAMSYVSRVFTN